MTTPPADRPEPPDPGAARWSGSPPSEPVSLDKPQPPDDPGTADGPLDFDPYRFGAPERPVSPEYAPPGYRPPSGYQPPPPAGSAFGGYRLPAPLPPSGYQQYPQPRTGNGKAIAALVLGIASIVLCWTSVFDAIPVLLAIIFGILALADARRRPGHGGRGMAVAGIACAVVGVLLAAALTVFFYSRLRPCLDYNPSSAQYKTCIRNNI